MFYHCAGLTQPTQLDKPATNTSRPNIFIAPCDAYTLFTLQPTLINFETAFVHRKKDDLTRG